MATGVTNLLKQVVNVDKQKLLQDFDITLSQFSSWNIARFLILGVTIAFVLALFAGLAGFLPYLGPIIGAVPMVLVAGGDSLHLAIWVVCLYVLVPFVESSLLTPLIQARAVSLPPAVVILNQLVLGVLFGILGLALATKRLRRFILVRAHYAC